jgi:predicted alpha/beta-hydrolase family hydrolase
MAAAGPVARRISGPAADPSGSGDASTRFLLYPGAGTDRSHPSLIAIEQRSPVAVTRLDFPYRRAGRRAPDRAPVLVQSVLDDIDALVRDPGSDPGADPDSDPSVVPHDHRPVDAVVLGGRSMGGRICSMAAPDSPVPVRALVLVCYPLHPPGKPDSLRVEHLPRITVPCLFVSGTRDAFGTPAELERWTATIPGPVTHVWIEGAGHDLRRCDEVVADAVASFLTETLSSRASPASPATRRPHERPTRRT